MTNLRTFLLHSVCVVVTCSVVVAPQKQARAQEAASTTRDQYRKAFELLSEKKWVEGRDALKALWDRAQTWDVAAGLGQAEFKLGNHAVGTGYMAFALANLPPRESIKESKRLESLLAQMKKTVAVVHISVSKDGAEVWSEGRLLGTSPLPSETYLDPGTRTFDARLPSGAQAKETLALEADKTYQVALVLERTASEAAPPLVAPPTVASPSAENSDPAKPLDGAPAASEHRPKWTPAIVTGGLAVVAAAVGVGFALDAHSARSDSSDKLGSARAQFGESPCFGPNASSTICKGLADAQDRQSRSQTLSTVSFVASGVFAASAVGSYFLWAKPGEPQMTAWGGPSSGGISLQGKF